MGGRGRGRGGEGRGGEKREGRGREGRGKEGEGRGGEGGVGVKWERKGGQGTQSDEAEGISAMMSPLTMSLISNPTHPLSCWPHQ